MIVPEEVVHKFTYPITAISILANSVLIFVILTTQNKQVGAYRFLLLSFAVVDILISIVHCLVVPAIVMTEFGLIFFGFRFLPNSTGVGIGTALIFVALFYQTFILLAFHYVYRYVLLCNPEWLRWIGAFNPWRNWITLAIIIDVLYIGGFMLAIKAGFLPDETSRTLFSPVLKEMYNIDLFATNLPGYLGIAYWLFLSYLKFIQFHVPNVDGSYAWYFWSLVSIVLIIILFFGSGFVIVFCIWKVRSEMKQTQSHVANRTRYMQNQLFRTLLIQTIFPTLTSYIPLGSVFVFPLTGVNLGGWGTVSMMSTAVFPMIDPFLVLFLVSGYRSRLPHFVQHILSSTHASVVATTTQKTSSSNTRGRVNEGSSGHAAA